MCEGRVPPEATPPQKSLRISVTATTTMFLLKQKKNISIAHTLCNSSPLRPSPVDKPLPYGTRLNLGHAHTPQPRWRELGELEERVRHLRALKGNQNGGSSFFSDTRWSVLPRPLSSEFVTPPQMQEIPNYTSRNHHDDDGVLMWNFGLVCITAGDDDAALPFESNFIWETKKWRILTTKKKTKL